MWKKNPFNVLSLNLLSFFVLFNELNFSLKNTPLYIIHPCVLQMFLCDWASKYNSSYSLSIRISSEVLEQYIIIRTKNLRQNISFKSRRYVNPREEFSWTYPLKVFFFWTTWTSGITLNTYINDHSKAKRFESNTKPNIKIITN